jgi:putative membrane protein
VNLYINCGLIRKTSYTFAHEKVNAVFIKQPVLARIFGLYSIEVAVVGLGNEKAETPQLCLLVNKAQMEQVIAQCAADFTCGGTTISSHKAALIPAAVQTVILSSLTLLLLFTYNPYTWFIFVTVFVFSAMGGWLAYKTKTIAYDNGVFHYSKGIFAKQKAMFKYGDIQDTRIRTNFLLRGMNVGKMSLNILSGAKMKAHRTGYFELPNFETVSSRVVEHEDSSTGLLG